MAELVVVGFDTESEADRALTELLQLEKEYLIDLEDAVVAIRTADGRVRLKQSVDLVGASAAGSGLWGAMWGMLVGLLFLNPILGFLAGGVLGAGAGALSASLADYGIDDGFIRGIGETLTPGSSALFLLVRKAQPDKVIQELSGIRGRVIRSSLSPDQEARLRSALSGSGVAMPGMAQAPDMALQPALTRDEVLRLCGDLDDGKVAAIIESGATIAEIEEAVAWSRGEDDLMGDERKRLTGRVADVCDILTRDEYPEEDRA